MQQVPRGYALVPVQPVSSRGLPIRRTIILVAGLAALWWGVLGNITPARADSVAGRGTNGACVGPGHHIQLWQQSITGLSGISIRYKLTLKGSGDQPTVYLGRWQGNSGGFGPSLILQQGQTTGDNNDAIFWVTESMTGTSITFQAGSSGTWEYDAFLRGYSVTSCMVISDVIVTRHINTGPQVTAPPGGGGIAPTPTPASVPTAPTMPTFVPGATSGPGLTCFVDREGDERCYPPPPSGWCWDFDGDSASLIACQGPDPTPTAPPGGPCDGHWWCMDDVSITSGDGSFEGNAGYPGVVPFVTGTYYNYGASHRGVSNTSGCGSWQSFLRNSDSNNDFPGSGSPIDPFGFGNGDWEWLCPGVDREEITGQFQWDSDDNAHLHHEWQSGSGTMVTAWTVWFDPVGWTAPTPSPAPSGGPTLPPNWCGVTGATCPPFNGGGIDVEVNVDICEDDPNILACLYANDPSDPDSGSGGGGDGAPDGTMGPAGSCAPTDPTTKVGYVPYAPIPTLGDLGAAIADKGLIDGIFEAAGWTGDAIVTIPDRVGNGFVWVWNTADNAFVPGDCLGTLVTDFTDDMADKAPFSFYFDMQAALEAPPGTGVSVPPMEIAGADIDVNDAFSAVAEYTAPYSGIIQLIPWFLGALLIMRKVMGTVGAGEGGG